MLVKKSSKSALRNFIRAFSNGRPITPLNQEAIDRWTKPETYDDTRKHIAYAMTIPPEAFYDESYFVAEQQTLFSKEWFCVGHAQEVPQVGDTKIVDVGTQSYIVTRDKKNKIHVFYNVCRHRGAKLIEDTKCVNRKRLNCPYHSWSYRLSGELISTPHFGGSVGDFRKQDYPLLKCKVELFNGLIFINQDKDAEPLAPRFGTLTESLLNYPLQEMEILGSRTYEINCDWKLLAENFMEWYHVAPVHPELAKFSTPEHHLMREGKGHYVGFMTHPLTNSGGPADTTLFHSTPGSNAFDQETAFFYHLFPNIALTIYPHSVYTLVMLPVAPGVCKETLYLLQHPTSRLETDTDEVFQKKANDLLEFVCDVNAEDIWIVNRVSKGVKNVKYRGGRFQPDMERTCYRYQNMIADAMISRKMEYPVEMVDYYKCFPHLHPNYVPPEAVVDEEVADSLLNMEGTTTSDLEQEASETNIDEFQYTLVEVDQANDTMKVVADLENQI